jgi:hypothetical protein
MAHVVENLSPALNRRMVLQQASTDAAQPESGGDGLLPTPRSTGRQSVQPAAVTTLAELACDGQWQHFGVAGGSVVPVVDRVGAVFSARVVPRNFGLALAVLSGGGGLLINGFPALRFSLLGARCSLAVPGANAMLYVAEKIAPYVGPPPPEILGKDCPICKVPFDVLTRVGGCRCGQFYHFETAESHPHVREEDLLRCFQQTGVCHCRGVLTAAEQITGCEDEL